MAQQPSGTFAPTPAEEAVAGYIAAHPDGDFSGVLAADVRREVFYHLSPMRSAVLAWYPFAPGARVLEVGGEMGALTGALCAACAHVTTVEENLFYADALRRRWQNCENLTVLPGLPDEGPFDYVVAMSPTGVTAQRLRQWRALLNETGRLLLAVDNRLGLRFFCGERSRTADLPFEDVAGLSGLATRAELEQRLAEAGFSPQAQRWYYPARDHWFTQEVFSDDRLPTPEGNGRYLPETGDTTGCVLNERALLPDIVENGLFPAMCNSFFVECRMAADTPPCGVQYAALTAGRPRAGRFATLIWADTVQKKALCPEAAVRLQAVMDHNALLAARGVATVPHTLRGGVLEMPRVPRQPLLNQWAAEGRAGTFCKERFLRQMDALVACIRRSSETEPPGTHGWPAALGPVQKAAFPELVPANCFTDESPDELLFFDQEFLLDHSPQAFVVFRAVACAAFAPPVQPLVEELKARYGVADIWPRLLELEAAFQRDIFDLSASDPLAGHAAAGRVIAKNRGLLAMWDMPARLAKRGWNRVAVYGFGVYGQMLCRVLESSGVAVAYALDQNPPAQIGAAGGVAVFRPEEAPDTPVDAVIVAMKKDAAAIADGLRTQTGRIAIPFFEV